MSDLFYFDLRTSNYWFTITVNQNQLIIAQTAVIHSFKMPV